MRISVARTLAMVRMRWKQGAAFYNTPVTKSKLQPGYDPACRDCPRLAAYLDQVGQVHPDYHARPVAPFGSKRAALLVVGLAPGLHGANRTGRPCTDTASPATRARPIRGTAWSSSIAASRTR